MLTILASGVWGEFAVGFGAAAAILAIGGLVVLRFQRNRHEYALMRAALERGITSLHAAHPAWLISLRQGMMILTLGAGLILVGGVAWWLAVRVSLQEVLATESSAEMLYAPKPRDEQGRLQPEGRLYTIVKNQWERAQDQRAVGMALAGAGAILSMLGAVRVALAGLEKRQFDRAEAGEA